MSVTTIGARSRTRTPQPPTLTITLQLNSAGDPDGYDHNALLGLLRELTGLSEVSLTGTAPDTPLHGQATPELGRVPGRQSDAEHRSDVQPRSAAEHRPDVQPRPDAERRPAWGGRSGWSAGRPAHDQPAEHDGWPRPGQPPAALQLRIHPGSRAVYRDGEPITLTRIEFDLLLFLAEHPRRVLTRRQLLGSVWETPHVGQRTVDVHIRRLRAKIGEDLPLVTTVRGIGYRLDDRAEVTVVRAS